MFKKSLLMFACASLLCSVQAFADEQEEAKDRMDQEEQTLIISKEDDDQTAKEETSLLSCEKGKDCDETLLSSCGKGKKCDKKDQEDKEDSEMVLASCSDGQCGDDKEEKEMVLASCSGGKCPPLMIEKLREQKRKERAEKKDRLANDDSDEDDSLVKEQIA